jgi:hypothetical protein
MPSKKKTGLLGDEERKRLAERAMLKDAKIKATNDYRVKKKLIKWLEDAPDVIEILDNVPIKKIEDDLSDSDVYRLLRIVARIMKAKWFMAIKGDLNNPDEWKATRYRTSRPVNDVDIFRTMMLLDCLVGIESPMKLDTDCQHNPAAMSYKRKQENEFIECWERMGVTREGMAVLEDDNIRPGIDKIAQLEKTAFQKYLDNLFGAKEEPPK